MKRYSRDYFSKKTALVIGGGSSVGFHTAKVLAARGTHVILVSNDSTELDEAMSALDVHGWKSSAIVADLSDRESIDLMCKSVRSRFSLPDIIVFAAGSSHYRSSLEVKSSEAVEFMNLRFGSSMQILEHFLEDMATNQESHIVFVTGIFSWMPFRFTAHSATDHALKSLAKSLHFEFGHRGMHVMHAEIPLLQPVTGDLSAYQARTNRLPRWLSKSAVIPQHMAGLIIRGMERRKKHVTTSTLRIIRFLYMHAGFSSIINWWNRADLSLQLAESKSAV